MTRLCSLLPESFYAIALCLAACVFVPANSLAADDSLESEFQQVVIPFLNSFCIECHQGTEAEAMLDLKKYNSARLVARDHQTWAELLHRVAAKEMPPAESKKQPTTEERQRIVKWIEAYRSAEAKKHAGDPGSVPVRRLNNSELNYAIRDITGHDLKPTREFPVDPANEAGFDNSAQSLSMSPSLVNKSIAAARFVSEHMVLTPDGIRFAPHPVVTETDRDKLCVKRIVEFYKQQSTDLNDYFFACWQHKVTADGKSIAMRATEHRLSPKYLNTIWNLIHDPNGAVLPESASLGEDGPGDPNVGEVPLGAGPLAVVRRWWLRLPSDAKNVDQARAAIQRMTSFINDCRIRLKPKVDDIKVKGIHVGAQPFVLWKNGRYAHYRQRPFESHLENLSPGAASFAIARALTMPEMEKDRKRFVAEIEHFCRIFPDAFYVSERGRDYVGKPQAEQEKGRLLSAGFHSMMGYYRDDEPLMKLMLSNDQRAELDRLWQELDFVTSAPMRQYTGFVWFERTDSATIRDAEFDFARAEDKNVTSAQMIERLAAAYHAKAERLGADEVAIDAIEQYYIRINQQIRWVEEARRIAEPHHIDALLELAEQAYRRELTVIEQAELREFYHRLRNEDKLSHEDAIRDVFVSILLAPEFNYRLDLAATSGSRGPLSSNDLASRLSFFLWSSIPDRELRELAKSDRLRDKDVLKAQVARMLDDPRSRSLSIEFGGQWLDFRRFEEHNSVDRERFPAFTDDLRSSMFEEPVRFLDYLIRSNRSVFDCIEADYLIINETLGRHYGVKPKELKVEPIGDGWARVPKADKYGRGGLLPMSVFLTQNAPGRRTSPVKRGYWVVRRVLGEHIPAPPPKVPELPSDEAQLGELTLRETLAKHREHASCAGCHNRFDSLGLIFESFGPIGERRQVDLAGKPVDTKATFPSGEEGQGVGDLQRYILQHRRDDFVDNLCRKLLSFALGRTLILSDEELVSSMKRDLAARDYRVRSLIETIVLSPQFLEKRGRIDADSPQSAASR